MIVNEEKIQAPFKRPAIKKPDFGRYLKLLVIDFGAVPGR